MSHTMRLNRMQARVAAAALAVLGFAAAPAQEPSALLRWKNGDVLPGTLLESQSNRIRWGSPLFPDALILDTIALDSIRFPEVSARATEAFRVGTTSGDVFAADLIGSDERTLVFSGRRYGRIRVHRDAIYSLDRLDHPNVAFEASQAAFWGVTAPDGPIKNLTYKVYDGSRVWPGWTGPVPDLARLTPVDEGAFAVGHLDLGLAKLTEEFAVVFAGQLETAQEGDYTFELAAHAGAELYIDGRLLGIAYPAREVVATVKLGVGFHSLRVEYAKYSETVEPLLALRWTGPHFKNAPLTGTNPPPGWSRGAGGYLHTDRRKASIYREIELPDPFEIDLELASSASPRFVLALGEQTWGAAESPRSVRLETWDNELVVVQDKVFEPVMTLGEDQREVRLRVAFDGKTGALRVLDSAGRALLKLEGVRPTTGKSGILIRNRGEDLTVRRLRMYRHSTDDLGQEQDTAGPRVRLMDGQVVPGRLFVDEGGAYVIAENRERRDVDLADVDRIVQPGGQLLETKNLSELVYADGAIVRGRVERANADHVWLQTGFSETPVACALAGAALLRFGSPAPEGKELSGGLDELFLASGRLRGRLSFDAAESPVSWRPEGAVEPLRLGGAVGARVERESQRVSQEPSFVADEFPHRVHLKNGEVFPCRVLSCDGARLEFQSPFVQGRTLASMHVKAIDFKPSKRPNPNERSASDLEVWLQRVLVSEEATPLTIDPAKLDRALTIPRFSRENPPSHILVARTGDMKRGALQAISGTAVEFESKLRRHVVPIDRITLVVDVSQTEEGTGESAADATARERTVRAALADGTVLAFEPVEASDGRLHGRSAIYGEIAIPTESIQRLTFGELGDEESESPFKDWVVRPAREPDFSKPPSWKGEPPGSAKPTG